MAAKKANGRGFAIAKKRKSAIVIWKGKDGRFFFHLKGSNGRVLLPDSGGFVRRNEMLATLKSVVEIFQEGRFVIVDPSLPQDLAAN